MIDLVLELSRYVSYALLIACAFSTGLVVFHLGRARRAPFYAARERALKRAKRWLLVALALVVVAVDLLILTPWLAETLYRSGEQMQGALTSTPTRTVMVTSTPRPTRTPTATPTRRPTATPPFIPTPTPGIPPPESALTPLPSAVPAGEDARITVITLATDRDESGQPVDPGSEFPPGDHPVYLFISYEGMTDEVAWTFAIYREGEFLESATQLWKWGTQGRAHIHYKPPAGYEPGMYEMRVFIEERLQGIAQFVITDEVGVNE